MHSVCINANQNRSFTRHTPVMLFNQDIGIGNVQKFENVEMFFFFFKKKKYLIIESHKNYFFSSFVEFANF